MNQSFENAFFWALNYNGWDINIDAMYEYLMDPSNRQDGGYVWFPAESKSACVTADDMRRDKPNAILWMCLVQMFGDYGVSPRTGWIEEPDEACEWIRRMQRETYHGGSWEDDEDGTVHWCVTDGEIKQAVDAWEAEMRMRSAKKSE